MYRWSSYLGVSGASALPSLVVAGPDNLNMLDIIGEVASALVSSLADWTARGTIVFLSAISLGLGSLTTWLILTSEYPLNQRAWGASLIASCICVGLPALFLSLLHLIRDDNDQALATICVAVNAYGVLVPVLWLLMR